MDLFRVIEKNMTIFSIDPNLKALYRCAPVWGLTSIPDTYERSQFMNNKNETESTDYSDYKATYSPEDNKLRLYSAIRLDEETYQRVRAEGFKWAPKQDLFVAPKWTPEREDFLLELCGEIGDEDTSLVDRAEMRAERFEVYSDKREAEAEQTKDYVKSITDNIPLGQPILVGHHSENRARKDAERIEKGMQKAVKLWDTSRYWKMRANGALRHAKYKERPDVRARRIKKIEAEQRKALKEMRHLNALLKFWNQDEIDKESALHLCSYHDHCGVILADGNRNWSAWSALHDNEISVAELKKQRLEKLPRMIHRYNRWNTHFENRLIYEKAMLGEQGRLDLLKPKPRPKQLPLLNYKAPEGINIENMYHKGEFLLHKQVELTKAEYAKIHKDYKGTRPVENSHRVRVAMYAKPGNSSLCVVFLTDSKVHKKPAPGEKKIEPKPKRIKTIKYVPPERTEYDNMKDTLRTGIHAVSTPHLFPTPPEIAEEMVRKADIQNGQSVLEPSAGTGNIVFALRMGMAHGYAGRCSITAVEINYELSERLINIDCLGKDFVHCEDFLNCNGDLGKYDRIIMNPPFSNGIDIKHIQHAISFLKPDGRLVSLCANGPRQRKKLMPLADYWEDLQDGAFKVSGTDVRSAMLVVNV